MSTIKPMLAISGLLISYFFSFTSYSQSLSQNTYINPLNIDYTYAIYDSHRDQSYRSGADPAVVEFRGEYYMFVTRSMGYWHSKDLQNWSFIEPQKWYFEGSNAPSAHNYKDSVLYVRSYFYMVLIQMMVCTSRDPILDHWIIYQAKCI